MKTYTRFIGIEKMKYAKVIYRALSRLKSTVSIDKPVLCYYGTVQEEFIITLETTMTDTELDNWLYTKKAGWGYIGNGYMREEAQ